MEQLTPRFVHIVDAFVHPKSRWSGATIAYIRYDDSVLFGYTLCLNTDQYSKVVGRHHALLSLDNSSSVFTSNKSLTKVIDVTKRAGFVDMSVFKEYSGMDSILSDQLITDVRMFDFKHAFISEVLADVLGNFLYDEFWE